MVADDAPDAARIPLLRGVPLFEDLSENELRLLAGRCSERRLPAGETVFREGDGADGLYVIESGVVSIVRNRVGQPVQRLARLGSGGFFGEMGLLDGGARTATAVTSEPTVLLHVRTGELLRLFHERPLLAVKLRAAVIRRHGENVVSTLQLSGRQELRTRVHTDVELVLADGSVVTSRLENLSPGGACLHRPPAWWKAGREVHFDLRMPGGEILLAVRGRVAWRNPRAAGIAFDPPARGDVAAREETVRRALRRLLDGVEPA